MQADDPLLVRFTTCVVCWPAGPLFAPKAKVRFAGWHVPDACACVAYAEAEAAPLARVLGVPGLTDDSALAVGAALADEDGRADVAGPADELLELCDEQPAAMSPAAETQAATAIDEKNRMLCPRIPCIADDSWDDAIGRSVAGSYNAAPAEYRIGRPMYCGFSAPPRSNY